MAVRMNLFLPPNLWNQIWINLGQHMANSASLKMRTIENCTNGLRSIHSKFMGQHNAIYSHWTKAFHERLDDYVLEPGLV